MSAKTVTQKDIMDAHFDKRVRDFVHTSFPAEITRVVSAGVVDVQPLISTMRPDGQIIPYPELFDVRVQYMSVSNGNVKITLPYKVGDKVWCFVSERDTASLMTNGIVNPNTTITHDLSDCFCIPSFLMDTEVVDSDPDNIVIQHTSSKITIKQDGVYIDGKESIITASEASIVADNIALRGKVGFNGKDAITAPTITGSTTGNPVLKSLLTELQKYGLIIDATTV